GTEAGTPTSPGTISGTLEINADWSKKGEAAYEISMPIGGGIRMSSRGTFSFKVLFATLVASFSEEIALDPDCRPETFALQIDAPLGIGSRRVEGEIREEVVHLDYGDQESVIRLGEGFPLVLGTFSTYALIPLLFDTLAAVDAVDFEVIVLFARRDGEAAGKDGDATLRVERSGKARIDLGPGELLVDRYLLTSRLGESELLAKGDEFLALLVAGGGGTLIAYRSDYFPGGIELPHLDAPSP
ncbi:hypothetical protein DRQ26_03495, partial [bacterium]